MSHETAPAANFCLVLKQPNEPTREVSIQQTTMSIGRDVACDITLQSSFVSRQHALVELGEGGLMVTDLGSTNGTFVNGKRLRSKVAISPGDKVNVGDVTVDIRSNGDAGAATQVMLSVPQDAVVCDKNTRDVWIRGRRLEPRLSAKEFDLMSLLCARPGHVRTRDELADAVWGPGNSDHNMLYQLLLRLRRKLRGWDVRVESVTGVGYCIATD